MMILFNTVAPYSTYLHAVGVFGLCMWKLMFTSHPRSSYLTPTSPTRVSIRSWTSFVISEVNPTMTPTPTTVSMEPTLTLDLATHEPYFTILREEFKPGQPRPCEICGQIGWCYMTFLWSGGTINCCKSGKFCCKIIFVVGRSDENLNHKIKADAHY